MTDLFTHESLRKALGNRPFRYVESAGSTQDLARAWATDDPTLVDGALVIAEQQTAGRGRQGRHWISKPGTQIMFSAILHPHIPADQIQRVTMAAAVAVHEALTPYAANRVTLKWPNDVLLDGRKVCGILTEATWAATRLDVVVIGIGLNVRVDFTGTELALYATSLEPATGQTIDRHVLLADLAARLDHWTDRLLDDELFQAWRNRLDTLSQRVTIYPQLDGSDPYDGLAEDVDPDGALRIRRDDGTVVRVVAGDVGLGQRGRPPTTQ